MKQVVNVALGGRCYTIDEDAYQKLKSYLEAFKADSKMGPQSSEMMDEVEMSIADIFDESLSQSKVDVINEDMVSKVIARLGMPDGKSFNPKDTDTYVKEEKPDKRLFRDSDDMKIGGVCSGLAAYFSWDVSLLRVAFVVAFLFGAGLCVYLVLWIAVPLATTPTQKCIMRGEPVTAENIRKYSSR